MTRKLTLIILLNLLFVCAAFAQTTAFTYQGSLNNGGAPANGNYEMQFKLFDMLAGGAQIGATVTDGSVAVINGSFTTPLDFGAAAFIGPARYLEIAVRPMGNPDPHTILAPRQQITSAPYAIQARNATTADTATNALSLGGVAANQYVLTGDARLTDSRNPLPNSTNYIQNQNAGPQAASNFNISGNGTAGSMDVNGALTQGGIAPPAVAPAGQGRFYFDSASNKVKVSENGSAFVNLVGATGVSGSGTVNSIPFWSAGTTLGNSQITQSANGVQLPNGVQLAVGAQGNRIAFGSPNGETGMTIYGTSGRADLRFDGTTLRLLAGPAGSPPTNGITISPSGDVRHNAVFYGFGLVRAMLKVFSDGGIHSCYNGYTGNSTPNCGFVVTHTGVGRYHINFGQAASYFACVTAYDVSGIGASYGRDADGSFRVITHVTSLAQPASNVDWGFVIIVF